MRALLLLLCFVLTCCHVVLPLNHVTQTVDDEAIIEREINRTLYFIENGKSQIIFTKEKHVTFVMGISGSGKSTLLQYLFGDNSQLQAVRVNGEIIIQDSQDRIGSGTKSKTAIPELIVDHENNHAYYDCPGFKDTRNASINIATSYFLQTLFDNADKAKLIFVIAHTKLRTGVDRSGFLTLLDSAINIMGDVNKFSDGIILVVTKIDRKIKQKNKKTRTTSITIFETDMETINNIAKFLLDAREEFLEIRDEVDITTEQKELVIKKIAFIDILLTRKDMNYTKILLFRRPDYEGLISEDEDLQLAKSHMLEVINLDTKFVAKNKTDIQFLVSGDTIVYITRINKRIENTFKIKTKDIFEKQLQNLENVVTLNNDPLLILPILRKINYILGEILAKVNGNILLSDAIRKVGDTLKSIFTDNNLEQKINEMISISEFSERISRFAKDIQFLDIKIIVQPLEKLNEIIFKLIEWNEFLPKLLRLFKTYKYQYEIINFRKKWSANFVRTNTVDELLSEVASEIYKISNVFAYLSSKSNILHTELII